MISTQSQIENQYHPIEYDQLLSMRSGSMKRLLEFDITDLNSDKLTGYMNKLNQLADFAALSRIQIGFNGLNEYIMKAELSNTCSCFSKSESHPKRELVELMVDIQTKSKVSPRKYDIDLIF